MVIRNRQVPPIAPPIIADVFFFFRACARELLPFGFGSAVIVASPPEDRLDTWVDVVVGLKLPVDSEMLTRGNLRAKMSDNSGSAQP